MSYDQWHVPSARYPVREPVGNYAPAVGQAPSGAAVAGGLGLVGVLGLAALALWLLNRPKRRPTRAPARAPSPKITAQNSFGDSYYEYAKSPTASRKQTAQAAFRAARRQGVGERVLVDAAANLTYEMDYIDAQGAPLSVTKPQMWTL